MPGKVVLWGFGDGGVIHDDEVTRVALRMGGRTFDQKILDPDLLTATKVLAASRQESESQVVENALRAYLRAGQLESARANLRALMDRVSKRGASLSGPSVDRLNIDRLWAWDSSPPTWWASSGVKPSVSQPRRNLRNWT